MVSEFDRLKRVGFLFNNDRLGLSQSNTNRDLQSSGWIDLLETKRIVNDTGYFDVNIPLKLFLGFAEDCQKIIINCRHELVLTRANIPLM